MSEATETQEKTPEQLMAEEQASETKKLEAQTPEDRDAAAKFLLEQAEAPPAEQAAPKPAAATPSKKKVPKPAPVAAASPATAAPAMTAEAIAEAVGRGVAAAITPKEKKEEEKKEDISFLSEKETRMLPVFKHMASLNPKYKDLRDTFVKCKLAERDYRNKWETEHPGQDFDPDAEEHNAFYAKNDIDFDDDDFVEAKADMKANEAIEKHRNETKSKFDEFEFKEKVREAFPEIYRETKRNARNVFTEFGEDYAKIVNDQGAVDWAAIKAVQEKYPVTADIVLNTSTQAEIFSSEISRLYKGMMTGEDGKVVPYDGKKQTPFVKAIEDFAVNCEKNMMEMQPHERLDDKGRPFVESNKFYRMNKEEQSKHWTFDAKHLSDIRTAELIVQAKAAVNAETKKHHQWLKSQGIEIPKEKETPPAPKPAEKPPEEEQAVVETAPPGKPVSPSSAGGPRTTGKGASPNSEGAGLMEKWL